MSVCVWFCRWHCDMHDVLLICHHTPQSPHALSHTPANMKRIPLHGALCNYCIIRQMQPSPSSPSPNTLICYFIRKSWAFEKCMSWIWISIKSFQLWLIDTLENISRTKTLLFLGEKKNFISLALVQIPYNACVAVLLQWMRHFT